MRSWQSKATAYKLRRINPELNALFDKKNKNNSDNSTALKGPKKSPRLEKSIEKRFSALESQMKEIRKQLDDSGKAEDFGFFTEMIQLLKSFEEKPMKLNDAVAVLEKAMIKHALSRYNKIGDACDALGLSRSTMATRRKEFEI